MKTAIRALISATVFLVVGTLLGGPFVARQITTGSNTRFYVGTADTATTFAIGDAYATNRTYVDALGNTVYPKATNSTTGIIYPSFGQAVPALGASAGVSMLTTLHVVWQVNTALTNTVALRIVRSCDGGLTYDTWSTNWFQVTLSTPTGELDVDQDLVLSTNMPTAFTHGASHYRIQQVVTAANPTDGGRFQITRAYVSGFTP